MSSSQCIATHYMREIKIILYCTRITLYLVYVLVHSVIINIELYNPQETKALFSIKDGPYPDKLNMLVGSSETIRVLSTKRSSQDNDELKIRQWIAGVIDGDGYFGISKKGYCSLEIVMEVRDIACLYKIKNRYGGTVTPLSHAQAVRYRLHHLDGIKQVINDLNGLLLNPVRISQFSKICDLYNISKLDSIALEYHSRYLAGLVDSDGSIYMNIISQQVFITISQKNRYLLDIICSVYGGTVYSANKNNTAFKWIVSRRGEVLDLVDNYFHWNSCVSAKNKRFGMIKEFYKLSSLGATKSTFDSPLGKSLLSFKDRWDRYDGNID